MKLQCYFAVAGAIFGDIGSISGCFCPSRGARGCSGKVTWNGSSVAGAWKPVDCVAFAVAGAIFW